MLRRRKGGTGICPRFMKVILDYSKPKKEISYCPPFGRLPAKIIFGEDTPSVLAFENKEIEKTVKKPKNTVSGMIISGVAPFMNLTKKELRQELFAWLSAMYLMGMLRHFIEERREMGYFDTWEKWKQDYQSLLGNGLKKEAYPSVMAYFLSKIPDIYPLADDGFEKKKDRYALYLSRNLFSRDYVHYRLNTEQFLYYRKILCMVLDYLDGDKDEDSLVPEMIEKAYPSICSYIHLFQTEHKEKHAICPVCQDLIIFDPEKEKEESKDVACQFLMMYFRYLFEKGFDSELMLENLLFTYERTKQQGLDIHSEDVLFVTELFFVTKAACVNPHITEPAAIAFFSATKDMIKDESAHLEERGLIFPESLIDILEVIACCPDMDGNTDVLDGAELISQLRLLPKKKVKQILSTFIQFHYLHLYDKDKGVRNFADIARKVLTPEAIQYSNSVVSLRYLYLEKATRIKREKLREKGSSKMWNRLLCHIREELQLMQLAKSDLPVISDEEKEFYLQEYEYKQKYLELKAEMDEMKASMIKRDTAEMENAELRKKLAQAEKKLEEQDEDRKELVGLRNLLYTMSSDEEKTPDTEDIDSMARYLESSVKGAILGGHVNFQNKIGKYLPSWKKYPPSRIVPAEILRGLDILVIYTDYLDHPTYLTTIANMKNSNCRILFIHCVNMGAVIEKIYTECKEGAL